MEGAGWGGILALDMPKSKTTIYCSLKKIEFIIKIFKNDKTKATVINIELQIFDWSGVKGI